MKNNISKEEKDKRLAQKLKENLSRRKKQSKIRNVKKDN